MNTTSNLPRNARDVRDRDRLLRALGFRASSSSCAGGGRKRSLPDHDHASRTASRASRQRPGPRPRRGDTIAAKDADADTRSQSQSQSQSQIQQTLNGLRGFWVARLRLLVRLDPFVWLPFLQTVQDRHTRARLAEDEAAWRQSAPDLLMASDDTRDQVHQLLTYTLHDLQNIVPDEQCLYRVYVNNVRKENAFATVQACSTETTLHAPRPHPRHAERRAGTVLDGLVAPGDSVFVPSMASCAMPMLAGVYVPYQLPTSDDAVTDLDVQQPVLYGGLNINNAGGPTKTTGLSYIVQLVPPPSGKSRMSPKVLQYTMRHPFEAFVEAIARKPDDAPRGRGVDDDVDAAHDEPLRKALRTPYFVAEYQFLTHWSLPHAGGGYMFSRDTLVKAFHAKRCVFDDLYVIWFILAHGACAATETFVANIYKAVSEHTVSTATVFPARPPHAYIEDFLQKAPVDPLLQRWYTRRLQPLLKTYTDPPRPDMAAATYMNPGMNMNTNMNMAMPPCFAPRTPPPPGPPYVPGPSQYASGARYTPPSPMYAPTSPAYAPTSPAYGATSPATPTPDQQQQQADRYSPSSPTCDRDTPPYARCYNPASPPTLASGSTTSTSAAAATATTTASPVLYSPSSPTYLDGDNNNQTLTSPFGGPPSPKSKPNAAS